MVSSTFGSHFKIDFMWWYFGAIAALALISKDFVARSTPVRRAGPGVESRRPERAPGSPARAARGDGLNVRASPASSARPARRLTSSSARAR